MLASRENKHILEVLARAIEDTTRDVVMLSASSMRDSITQDVPENAEDVSGRDLGSLNNRFINQ